MASGLAVETPIVIRFDGLDADSHQIEIEAFATSIRGFGRIISVAANFAATQKYVQHKDAMDVRVVVEPPHPNCVTISAFVQWVSQNPLISTTVGGLLVALITYIFKRAAGQKEEMRHLKDSLDTAIKALGTRDQKVVDRLLDTVDKMADALKPAARQAVAPVGRTVRTVSIGACPDSKEYQEPLVIGTAERDAIEASEAPEINPEQTFEILIMEMNRDKRSGRVALADDLDGRIAVEIGDPVVDTPNNPYALAFAAQRMLKVRAKASIRDGCIEKLHISDTA